VTPLAAACLALLSDEAGMPPLSAESLSRVLWCTGGGDAGRPYTVAELEVALEELLAAGQIERVTTRKIGPRYRALKSATVNRCA
jgi:hypothetical protein